MSKKSKSPPAPKYSLEDLFANTQKLYEEFGQGRFNKEEIASTLGQSSTSGPFKNRFFSLKELGLIAPTDESGGDFEVTDRFMQMRTNDRDSTEFRRAAKSALGQADVFAELLGIFEGKLPSQENVAGRLESDLGFNPDPAKKVARVFEESMEFAGLMDAKNNILRIRESEEDEAEAEHKEEKPDTTQEGVAPEGRLTTEIPVGDEEIVTVVYPQDLKPGDARKVGAVLSALVGDDT